MTPFRAWYNFAMRVEVTRTLKNIVQLRYENGVLKVLANQFVSDKKLKQIIEENSEWIKTQKQDEKNKQSLEVGATKPQPAVSTVK